MAGVKGKSGGARPGAGRKPKPRAPTVPVVPAGDKKAAQEVAAQLDGGPHSMLRLLQEVALGMREASTLQVRAAIAAVQYTHTKRGDGGKKEAADDTARKLAGSGGKFSAAPPPKLAAVGGKKL